MANEQSILCPLCGNKVPPGLTRCPVCATELQRTITKRTEEAAAPSSDFLRKDIPTAKLPQTKSTCPQCGLGLQGGETKCPRCGIPLSAEEALRECPDCGALSPTDSKSCVRCGCNLRERRGKTPPTPPRPTPAPAPEVPAPVHAEKPAKPAKAEKPPAPRPETPVVAEKVTPPPAPAARPETPRKDQAPSVPGPSRPTSPGLVNGRGAVNGTGLVNGRGAVNGTGLVNGRGAVNGTGFTNGARAEGRPPTGGSRHRSVISKWQFLALLVAVIVIVPTFMYLTYSQTPSRISIDGQFEDWSDVTAFGMYHNSASDRTNVTEWSVLTDSSKLFIYVATRGDMMSTAAIDSFFVFVDSDSNESTGYILADIGADYKVEFDGWNGSVESASVCRYIPVNSERTDWNGWDDLGSPTARLGANSFEAVAALPSLGGDARYVLISQSGQLDRGISHAVREGSPILIIQESAADGFSSGVAASSDSVSAMRLTLTAQGGSGTVTSMTPSVWGATPVPFNTGTMDIVEGASRTVEVLVDTSSFAPGSVVTVSMVASDVDSSFDSVVVIGGPVKAYIASPPASIEIDGAFADWTGLTEADSDSTQMNDPNVDISSVGAVNTTASSSFYASVVGEMCGGSFVPAQITKPSGSGGGSAIPAKKSGEDVLRIYLDTDLSVDTGSVVVHPSNTIGADYMIEVLGLNGEITSKSIQEFASGSWNYVPGTILAANDEQQIEISISAASIDSASSIEFIVEMTDWRGWSDIATAVPQGTRTADMPGTRAWVVDNTINSAESTATSNQRKMFHDGISFWSIYVDGTDTVARYSTDGMTWTSDGSIFKTGGVGRASIWHDAASNVIYAVGDRTAATVNVYLQRGIVSPATHTITWSAADKVLAVSSYATASKNTYISRDATGYIWLMAVNCTGITPTRYDLSVFRSSVAGDVAGAWTLTGSMLVSTPQSTLKGCVLPTGTGSNMWSVYVYTGTVASKKYTGAWGPESVLYTPSGLGGNTEDAPPSALVDAKGVLHVVYGNDHEQPVGNSKPHIFYRYNTGSAWSAPVALSTTAANDGFRYPTISLDSSTGNLYAFWYDMQTQYVAAKRNVSGTWSALTLNAQTANAKAYLTSIYSAPRATLICYQWTQNTTAPIHVIFDRIPEFSDVALPALGMIAVVVLFTRSIGRRRESV